MNILDKVIGWFSPERAARRVFWRDTLEESLRHYDAGSGGRSNANWIATNQSGEYTDRYSRDIVRARARDLERNSDMMNSVVGPFIRNVVGRGFVLQAETDDSELNQQIEDLWKVWCKKRNCDITGTQSLNQILRMAVRRKRIDGGILFVKRYTTGGILPFKLQLFEVDELDSTRTAPKHKNCRVVGGIEYNQYNAPVGYWIRQYAIDGFEQIDPVYISAEDCIFYFSKKRPSQLREMSDVAHTISRVRDASEFMTAVGVKQRVEACFSLFIKKQQPTGTIGRSGTVAARETYDGKMLTPGMIKELNAGDDVVVVNPQGQATDASSYIKLQQHLLGAGQGISYEATARDMSETNYSSARQGLIEDAMTYAEEDELLAEILSEIYETFVISAVLAGRLLIPDFWGNREKYLRHSFTHPPKDWIDPERETKANQVALQSGQITFKQICAQNGQDWKKALEDMKEVADYAAALGLNLSSILGIGGVANGQQEPQDGEDANQGTDPASGTGGDANDTDPDADPGAEPAE